MTEGGKEGHSHIVRLDPGFEPRAGVVIIEQVPVRLNDVWFYPRDHPHDRGHLPVREADMADLPLVSEALKGPYRVIEVAVLGPKVAMVR